MEERPVVRHAGEEERRPGPGEEEGNGPLAFLVPPDDEEAGGGDDEEGAEGQEEDGEGRATADEAGGDVGDLAPERDQLYAEDDMPYLNDCFTMMYVECSVKF